jgi:uncharacterized membrane protein YuzA (DUF378 family)
MTTNVGNRDRLLRTILGVYGMLLGFLFIQGLVGNLLGILSAVSLVTGIVGWCGIYSLLGISTLTEQDLDAVQAEQGTKEA